MYKIEAVRIDIVITLNSWRDILDWLGSLHLHGVFEQFMNSQYIQ